MSTTLVKQGWALDWTAELLPAFGGLLPTPTHNHSPAHQVLSFAASSSVLAGSLASGLLHPGSEKGSELQVTSSERSELGFECGHPDGEDPAPSPTSAVWGNVGQVTGRGLEPSGLGSNPDLG